MLAGILVCDRARAACPCRYSSAGGLAQGIHSLDHIRGPLPSTLRAQRGRDEGGEGGSRRWRGEAGHRGGRACTPRDNDPPHTMVTYAPAIPPKNPDVWGLGGLGARNTRMSGELGITPA